MSLCASDTAHAPRRKLIVRRFIASTIALLVVGCQGIRDDPPARTPDSMVSTPPSATPRSAKSKPNPGPGWIGVVVPEATVDVVARTSGRLASVTVRPGDAVARGEILARIEDSGLDQEVRMAEAELEVARAEHQRAAAEAEREQERHRRREAAAGAVSREERESAAADARAAAALRDAAAAQIAQRQARVDDLRRRRADIALRAPFDGRVATRYFDVGALVSDGIPVLRLVRDGALAIRFAVPPDEATGLTDGLEVAVHDESQREVARATVVQIAPEVDIASQMLFVEAVPLTAETSTPDAATSLRAGGGVWIRRTGAQ